MFLKVFLVFSFVCFSVQSCYVQFGVFYNFDMFLYSFIPAFKLQFFNKVELS